MILELRDAFCQRKSLESEIELKRFELNKMEQSLIQKEGKVHNLIMEVSLLIMNLNEARQNIGDGQAGSLIDRIFLEDGENQNTNRQARHTLHELCNIIRFCYCTDNISPMTEEQLTSIEQYMRGR